MSDDLYSRDYDVKEITDDPRFVDCANEAKFVYITTVIIEAAVLIIVYTMGTDITKINLIWGYPAWFFWSTALLLAGVVLYVVWFMTSFKTPSLEPRADNRNVDINNNPIEKGGNR